MIEDDLSNESSTRDIYLKLWQLAKPYYEQGRPFDIAHIEWFIEAALRVCEKEGLDETILVPLAILHDVGYSQVADVKSADYYQLDIRREHMEKGAKIAKKLLDEVGYPAEKVDQIVHYVGVHDNWAFGEVDLFVKDPILGPFKDLDYLWVYSSIGFQMTCQQRQISAEDFLMQLQAEPSPIYGKKPFSNPSTKALHDQYLKDRISDVEKRILHKEKH